MATFKALNRGGKAWTPKYLEAINPQDCIGCGRCFKVCGFDVLGMIGVTEEGDVVDADDDDAIRKVMSVENGDNCVGCSACGRVCGKAGAQSHATAEITVG